MVIDQQTQADHAMTAVIMALIGIVFVLDLLSPLGIVIWVLYVIPLGLTTWSPVRRLLPGSAVVCSVLLILGYIYSPSGVLFEYAVINRSLGIALLWIVVFFLWPQREGRGS